MRLGAEAAEAEDRRQQARRAASAASASAQAAINASASRMLGGSGAASAPDLSLLMQEGQKDRVARKMQILDFFNAYGAAAPGRMTAEQTSALLAQLNDPLGPVRGASGGDSVESRLRQVSEACDLAFDAEL